MQLSKVNKSVCQEKNRIAFTKHMLKNLKALLVKSSAVKDWTKSCIQKQLQNELKKGAQTNKQTQLHLNIDCLIKWIKMWNSSQFCSTTRELGTKIITGLILVLSLVSFLLSDPNES